jgi:hypothetical protein
MLKQRVDTVELFRSPTNGTPGYQVLASLPLRALALGPLPPLISIKGPNGAV